MLLLIWMVQIQIGSECLVATKQIGKFETMMTCLDKKIPETGQATITKKIPQLQSTFQREPCP